MFIHKMSHDQDLHIHLNNAPTNETAYGLVKCRFSLAIGFTLPTNLYFCVASLFISQSHAFVNFGGWCNKAYCNVVKINAEQFEDDFEPYFYLDSL